MTDEKKEQLKNHIPTVKHLCDLFLHCLNAPSDIDEDAETVYLVELIDKMEIQLDGAKVILNS